MFNSVADLRTEEDRRINEWFKAKLSEFERCSRCGQPRDSDLHYIGTVDSHEFEPATPRTPPPTNE